MRHGSLHSRRSKRHHIRVMDEGDRRVLYFDDNPQTQMTSSAPDQGGLEYTTYVHAAWALAEDIRRVLVIGLGGGGLVREFRSDYPETLLDVVEIDPDVIEVACEYFGLPQGPRLRVVLADARAFLTRTRRKYDFVLMDAYTNDAKGRLLIPPHLATLEFFELAARRLTPRGWLGYNVTGTLTGEDSKITGAILTTMAEVFPHRCLFDMDEDVNLVLFASLATPAPTKEELRRRVAALRRAGVLKRPECSKLARHYHRSELPRGELVLRDPGAEVPGLMGCSVNGELVRL